LSHSARLRKILKVEITVRIGARNTIRGEFVDDKSVAQPQSAALTRIGDDNLLMAQAHVAHDCRPGNEIIEWRTRRTLAGLRRRNRRPCQHRRDLAFIDRIDSEALFVGGYYHR